MCVPFIINQTPAAGGDHCHGPQRSALSGLWAIPSTESGPQPLLVTYNLSSLALTSGEPTPYVCMYVSMVCGMYVGMYWVWKESTQVHREGGTVSSKGNNKCSVCDRDGASSQGAGYVRGCSGHCYLRFGLSPVDDQLDPMCCDVEESVDESLSAIKEQ